MGMNWLILGSKRAGQSIRQTVEPDRFPEPTDAGWRDTRLARTIAAIAVCACATMTGARAQQYVTLNDLAGMSCTGGPPFLGGITIAFDKGGVIYNVTGKGQSRGVSRDPFRGMLTYLSPDGATYSFERLSGNTLTGYGMNGVGTSWDCHR